MRAPAAGTAEVWRADLDRAPQRDLPLERDLPLSPAERERAARFRSGRDALRWSRCRAILRSLLGDYLGIAPGEVELAAGANGKLAVPGAGLEFNVSHARGTGLLAFASQNPVGVDIELDRRVRDPLAAAERVLGAAERERLAALPPAERDAAFLRSWVRHEAAVKCRGERLGTALAPGAVALTDLDAGPGAAAALALGRPAERILVRDA